MSASKIHVDKDPITDFSSLFAAATEAKSLFGAPAWFRGHASKEWLLLPSVYRRMKVCKLGPGYEHTITRLFKARAPLRVPSEGLPTDDDYFGWLTLARHFGLDTRLLDWTESFLVAAYFAVAPLDESSRQTTEDVSAIERGEAAIWAVHPGAINEAEESRIKPTRPRTRSLLSKDDVYVQVTAAFASGRPTRRIGPPDGPASVLAVVAQEFDLRMLVQRAHFTIHGDDTPLPEVLKKFHDVVPLACYPIAPGFRHELREGLRVMGIDRGFLFPDPDNMARAIMEEQALLAKLGQ